MSNRFEKNKKLNSQTIKLYVNTKKHKKIVGYIFFIEKKNSFEKEITNEKQTHRWFSLS